MKLPRQEIVSILITFVVGFLAGGYLYLNHFSSLISPDDVQDIAEVERLTIISEAYGSCGNECPAFQVKYDGSYRYRYIPELGAEPKIIEGTLPLNIQRDVKRAMDIKDLAQQSKPVNAINCASFADGVDIKYVVTVSGLDYELNSCGTAVDFNGDAWSELAKIWNYFKTVQ